MRKRKSKTIYMRIYRTTPQYKISRQTLRNSEDYKLRKKNYMSVRREMPKWEKYIKEYCANPLRKKHVAKWLRERRKNDIYFKLGNRVSHSIYMALRSKKDGRQWEDLVGYSATDLHNHLEALFKPGMNWDNMGEWHIDHVVPHSWLPYASTNDGNFKVIWSLYNLQPLWKEENMKKRDKFAG